MPPGESEFDMAAALTEIGGGLGFTNDGDSNGTTSGNGEGAATAAAAASGVADESAANADASGESGAAATGSSEAADGESAASSSAAGGDDGGAGDDATPAAGAGADAPPSTWKPGPAAKWGSLDPEIKAEIRRREADAFRGIEQYKEAANIGRGFQTAIEPFVEAMQRYGVDPYQQVRSLMQAHHTLALGTQEQRLGLMKQLMAEYKIDPAQLGASGEAPYVDPEVKRLRDETARLESTVNQITEGQRQQRASEIQATINKFAADPKNIYFEELAKDMAALIRAGVSTTVEDAYQKALWQNPVVRQKELTRQHNEKAEADRKRAADKVAQAQRATAANLPSAKSAGRTAPAGTMDDTIEATLAEIRSRGT